MGYLGDADPETFDHVDHLARRIAGLDPALTLRATRGRVALTRDDPLLCGVIYTPHLLRSPEGLITFGDVHFGLYRDALKMRTPAGIEGDRRAYIAPRGSGKSTSLYVITTLWIACHHPTFVAAFSDTGTQAEDHLRAVRAEFAGNKLIKEDYPDACTPVTNARGNAIADSAAMLYTRSGFCFSARGIDTGVLGLVDPLNRRPGIIYLDDIEGAEGARYSLYQAEQRLRTVVDGILPMNDRAHVRLVGTVTIPGGIMHQLVNTVITKDKPESWIVEERFKVTYFPPVVTLSGGQERSIWPGRWPMHHLQAIRRTRSFAKNFLNQPLGADGGYWTEDDITYGDVPAITRRALFVDGIVKEQKTTPDRTGIAIIGYSPTDGRCLVEHASGIMLTGGNLRRHLAKLIARHPRMIHGIVVETNQGGDLWLEILGPLGLKVITRHSSDSKSERLALALDQYQKPRPLVVHADVFPAAEVEMLGYPKYATDDVADAIAQGALFFLKPKSRKRPARATVSSYR
jgi:hypothetical protein